MRKIWRDISGRVPFSVLGIFLIIGSSITSTIYINLENTVSEETTFSLGAGELSAMLSFMQADLSVALNYAGMNAMDFVGRHPVTKPETGSRAALDYNGGSWNNFDETNGWNDIACKQFNMNWTKNITRVKLNPYIQGNYMDDVYCNGKYVINVIDPYPEREGGPVHDWRDITIKEVTMHLDREHTSPLPSVPDWVRNIFVAHSSNEEIPAYWEFSLPLQVEIKDVEKNTIIGRRIITISTLVNSRMPLLRELTEAYEKCLTGDGNIMDNKLFILMTLLSELYTEGRALAQYAGMYERIPNIVDTRWLQYLTNGVLLLEQFMVFNSIDPVAAIYLLLNAGDLAATGFPEEEDLRERAIELFADASDETLSSIFGKPNKDLLNTIANNTMRELRERASKSINYPRTNREINITQLAEDILYDTSYKYHYYNKTSDGVYHHFTNDTFLGYNAIIEGHRCFYMHPPPYYYYNKTYYEKHGYNLSKELYEGESINESIGGEMLTFNYTLNNNSASSHTSGCERNVRQALSSSAVSALERFIDETYKAGFRTKVKRETLDGYPRYDPPKPPDYDCRKDDNNIWHFVSATPVSSYLSGGDGITHFPYTEVWEVEWHQTHQYGHLTPQYVNGTYVGDICEGSESFTYVKKERVTFTIYGWTAVNVDAAFAPANVNFGHGERRDYNLFNISKKYVKDYFVSFRDDILTSDRATSSQQVTIPSNNNGENPYAMGWLRGYGGEVERALREILEEIKQDNITAHVSSELRYRDFNDTIDNHTRQLLAKYRPHMGEYIDEEAYRNASSGKYLSCAARVIAKMREWYVNEIERRLEQSQNEIKDSITENITQALQSHNINVNLGDREKVKNLGLDAGSLPAIQFGLTMPLTKTGDNYQWNEKVGFSINQEPDYFNVRDAENAKDDETTYYFLIKNICLFGPSGLPLLPTPVTPWVITVNCWYIHVEGQFTRFEVTDTVGEMQPNTLFGDTDYSYVRESQDVFDPCSGEPIGFTEPITFTVDTVNVAIVPPGFVGDINPSSYNKEVEGEGRRLPEGGG